MPGPTPNELKPRCALEVAVVGNRRFAQEATDPTEPAALRMKQEAATACAKVWQVIKAALLAARELEVTVPREFWPHHLELGPLRLRDFFNDQPPRLGVLSSLAVGADQFGVQAALAEPLAPIELELEAVLPFAERDYPGTEGSPRPEFTDAEAAVLRALCAQARQVIRLDGRYQAAGSPAQDDEASQQGRRLAYQQARDLLLQNADLVVAVYDPLLAGKPGGTQESVRLALAQGVPVVAVLVAEQESGARIALYRSPADRPAQGEAEWRQACPASLDNPWSGVVSECVKYLLSIPHLLPAPGESAGSVEQSARLRSLGETIGRLLRFLGHAPMHPICTCPWRGPLFQRAWRTMLELGRHYAGDSELQRRSARPNPAVEPCSVEPYAVYYRRASDLSGIYMRTYRGAFVLAFILAGLAVAAAVALLSAGLLNHSHLPLPAIVLLGGLKLAILVVLLRLEHFSRHERYQEHAADFRYLAELLRPMQWLAPLGTFVPAVEPPAHYAPLDPRQDWTQWLFRAIARSTPSVGAEGSPAPTRVTLDAAHVNQGLKLAADQWLQGQIDYHWGNAEKMHWLEAGLEKVAKGLLWIVLGCASVAVLLELALHFHLVEGRFYEVTVVVLGAVAAAVPAFIAAIGGILFQSEAKRLRIRSEAMYQGLVKQQQALREDFPEPQPGSVPMWSAWSAAQRLRLLASLMIAETGDWKSLYPLHNVKAG